MATYAQFIEFGPYYASGALCTLKVYHYVVGTTTLKDVYTDREKNTTAAQPLVSDANGIASCYADGLYKFQIDGSTDGVSYSTLYTYDKVAVADQSSLLSGEGAAISSASTLTLGADGDFFHVTGTTTTTAISGTQNEVTLVPDAAWPLTHSGNLILQSGADVVCTAGQVFRFLNEGAGVWRESSRSLMRDNTFTIGGSADATKKIAFEVDGLTTATTRTLTVQDASGTLALTSNFAMWIQGLTYSNNAGDATNDLDIAAGQCRDATNAHDLALSALTKQSDVAWAVGTNAGGLDTGAVGDSDYYIWAIKRADTGVCDVLYSLSSTAPTMPTNYGFKRLIGWFKRVAGAVVSFNTYELFGGGLELLWTSPTLDIELLNALTTARRTDAVKVPLDFSTLARLNIFLHDASAAFDAWVYCPDHADLAPAQTAAPLENFKSTTAKSGQGELTIRTSATGTIASRATLATVDQYRVSTLGFLWERRN